MAVDSVGTCYSYSSGACSMGCRINKIDKPPIEISILKARILIEYNIVFISLESFNTLFGDARLAQLCNMKIYDSITSERFTCLCISSD